MPSRRDELFFRGASDTWNGFPTSKKKLLNAIVAKNITQVVFLSGDYHSSNVTEITLSNTKPRSTHWSITSSGLFAPFARPRHRDYIRDSNGVDNFQFDNGEMRYEVKGFLEDDSFARIEVKNVGSAFASEITVNFVTADGTAAMSRKILVSPQ